MVNRIDFSVIVGNVSAVVTDPSACLVTAQSVALDGSLTLELDFEVEDGMVLCLIDAETTGSFGVVTITAATDCVTGLKFLT